MSRKEREWWRYGFDLRAASRRANSSSGSEGMGEVELEVELYVAGRWGDRRLAWRIGGHSVWKWVGGDWRRLIQIYLLP